MNEKTGFETTQELPLSDKDIMIIVDCLRESARQIKALTENSIIPYSAKMTLMERTSAIEKITEKLISTT